MEFKASFIIRTSFYKQQPTKSVQDHLKINRIKNEFVSDVEKTKIR